MTVPSMLNRLSLIDAELVAVNEVESLRILVTEYKKRIRYLELELNRRDANYKKPQILSEGYDPHPAWDYVAGIIAPTMSRSPIDYGEQSNRTSFACWNLFAAYHPLMGEHVGELALNHARIAMALKGKKFCDDWHYQFKRMHKHLVRDMIAKVKSACW